MELWITNDTLGEVNDAVNVRLRPFAGATAALAPARPPQKVSMGAPGRYFFRFFLACLCVLRMSLYALSFWATLTAEPAAAIFAMINVAYSIITY